jgi:hypothetical protein
LIEKVFVVDSTRINRIVASEQLIFAPFGHDDEPEILPYEI